MVRRRYYYRRVVRPKQKWAINFVDVNVSFNGNYTLNANSSTVVSTGGNVCTNSTRITATGSSTPSSAQILKTGRWKFKGILSNVSTSINYIIYFAYVPEGMYSGTNGNDFNGSDGDDIFYRHPEWVIAWTRKDYVSIEQSNEISLTGTLKRNLNTGDSIQLRVLMYNMGSTQLTVNSGNSILRGTVSYCCRAN